MKEVGSYAANRILAERFGDNQHASLPAVSSSQNIPTFTEPKASVCKLPGGYIFYTCQTPGLSSEKLDYLTELEDESAVLSV